MKLYRHKSTGTIYTRVVPGHGGYCHVTTMNGSTFVTRLDNVEEVANDSILNETQLQQLDVTELVNYLGKLNFEGKFALASRMIPTVDLGTHMIVAILAGDESHEVIFAKNAIKDFVQNVSKFLDESDGRKN